MFCVNDKTFQVKATDILRTAYEYFVEQNIYYKMVQIFRGNDNKEQQL